MEPLQTADVLHLWVVLQAHWNGSFHWVFIDLCNYCKKEANTAVIESRMCFWLRDLNTSVLIAVCWAGLLKMTQNCGIMNPSPEIKSVPCALSQAGKAVHHHLCQAQTAGFIYPLAMCGIKTPKSSTKVSSISLNKLFGLWSPLLQYLPTPLKQI